MFATKWLRQNIFLQVKSQVNSTAATTQYFEVQGVKRIEVLTTYAISDRTCDNRHNKHSP